MSMGPGILHTNDKNIVYFSIICIYYIESHHGTETCPILIKTMCNVSNTSDNSVQDQ